MVVGTFGVSKIYFGVNPQKSALPIIRGFKLGETGFSYLDERMQPSRACSWPRRRVIDDADATYTLAMVLKYAYAYGWRRDV